jgi:transposase
MNWRRVFGIALVLYLLHLAFTVERFFYESRLERVAAPGACPASDWEAELAALERTFAWLMKYRRLRADYENTVSSSRAWILLAMTSLMARRVRPA